MEEKFIVIVFQGKSSDRSEGVRAFLFNSETEANNFSNSITDTDDKYWVIALNVNEGQYIETHFDSLKAAMSPK